MITHIQGRLVEKNPTDVIIDCNGVGYQINISLHTYSLLPESESIKLFTYLIIKEEAHLLYGFMEKTERELFKLLLSVSGVGASTARTMLSSIHPKEITQAIALGNVATLQGIKGIGGKTAQRILLDLKDKINKMYAIDDISATPYNTNKDEALSALEVLGFVRKNTEKVVDKIVQNDPDTNVENIIKMALKML